MDHFFDAERAALNPFADICAQLGVPPLPPPVIRYRLKYGVMECMTCGLAKDYCKGHAPQAPPSQDGAESSLERRARACMGGR